MISRRFGLPSGAHPRSRGEHTCFLGVRTYVPGSSPLTRGARRNWNRQHRGKGLIPAHAGSTDIHDRLAKARRAHPRSRGEHNVFEPIENVDVGSSPLTRGARRGPAGFPARGGLIPAHAGSTKQLGWGKIDVQAHPRSRGEHVLLGCCLLIGVGSSPLTRGAHCAQQVVFQADGLIPAHAGSTLSSSPSSTRSRAHPRSRGEHSCTCVGVTVMRGSSPLTRGALRAVFCGEHPNRLIPAHAGST